MEPAKLTLRCYGEKRKGLWSIVCIDLCLAAQAKTEEEARLKLQEQIKEYICDACVGADKEHAEELLNRKAPLSMVMKYKMIKLKHYIHYYTNQAKQFVFTQPIPLKPC